MKIYYLHGLNSNIKKNISKINELKEIFDYEVIGIEYNSLDTADEIEKELTSKIDNTDFNTFIGTSLGGFWADCLAHKYNGQSVLFNPCYKPSIILKNILIKQIVDTYIKYEFLTTNPKTVFIGRNDELINCDDSSLYYKDRGYIVYFDGEHKIKTFKPFTKILQSVQYSLTC